MAFADGKLMIAGLSNEEFASKLRAIPYPFTTAEPGTSVEIFHGNHGQLETRSPAFGSATPITEPVKTETAGVPYEKIASMTGVEQMDLLDAQRSLVLARTSSGLNLAAVPLP